MKRYTQTIPALICALLATACSTIEERHQASQSVDKRHPIVVDTQVAALDIATDSYGGLTARSRQEVSLFVRDYKTTGTGVLEIHVATPSYEMAEAEIRDLAVIQGVPSNRVVVRSFRPPQGSRTAVRLAYARYVAAVPSCEQANWGENLGMSYDNVPYPSFGCATQQNIAAQMADPLDAVRAKPMDAASADRRTTIFDKYEKGQPTSSGSDEAEKATVSTVAQ